MLLPSIYKAAKNPGDVKLAQVIPKDVYKRWHKLWIKYGDGNSSIEKFRPSFVAMILYDDALEKSGLVDKDMTKSMARMADKAGVKIYQPTYRIKVKNIKQYLTDLASRNESDVECLEKTLDLVQNDIPNLQSRANDWATGEIKALLSSNITDRSACNELNMSPELVKKYNLGDTPKILKKIWLEAAVAAIRNNKTTVSALPITNLLDPNGYLKTLENSGYAVTPPPLD